MCIYIFIYISAVKISALTQEIIVFQFNALPLTQGRSLGLATPFITTVSVFFLDKKCIYSVAEHLYDHINAETFQTRTPASLQRQARGNRRAHSLYQFISLHEINYVHAMSWSVKA